MSFCVPRAGAAAAPSVSGLCHRPRSSQRPKPSLHAVLGRLTLLDYTEGAVSFPFLFPAQPPGRVRNVSISYSLARLPRQQKSPAAPRERGETKKPHRGFAGWISVPHVLRGGFCVPPTPLFFPDPAPSLSRCRTTYVSRLHRLSHLAGFRRSRKKGTHAQDRETKRRKSEQRRTSASGQRPPVRASCYNSAHAPTRPGEGKAT